MNYLRLPVIDHEEPTLGDLKKVIFLYDHIAWLGKVYCHCKGGMGVLQLLHLLVVQTECYS